jgi:hypothetical protein
MSRVVALGRVYVWVVVPVRIWRDLLTFVRDVVPAALVVNAGV